MAITKIHPIKSTLKKAIDYIVDPAKTDDKLLVSSFGCAVETADLEFEKTRLLAMQKGNNLAHQLIQAFEPGEVSYAQAHEIGRQLADEILGGKYEYVIATHINKEHCHTLPFSSQLADAVREAVRDYHEGSMYKRDEAVRTFRRNLFPRWKPSLGNVLACCDIFQIILEAAYEKYVSAANQNNQNYQEIARLGYVSKAYLVLAAIGTSGGALNLLAQMLINQANQYEADQRIPFFRRHPDIGTFVQQHAAPYGWPLNDNYALAYRVLQIVCGIQRGSQPYSHMKKAELVLKGYVSESSSTQLTSLNIAINGGLAMGHYWKGRLLLEQAKQDHDRCNDYKDAAIASFCATNVTERFDHLPENADEDAAPQLSPPQWLSAIELLRYPDREVFRVDRRMVFQTIYQKLTQQVEEVQSDRIQIHNERYRLTKKDVRSNMERCLDMVKVQFPDKEPLIQEMIRSIR